MLGVNGVGMVCHGGSSARAIKNAIGLAALYVENRVLDKMAAQLAALKAIEAHAGGLRQGGRFIKEIEEMVDQRSLESRRDHGGLEGHRKGSGREVCRGNAKAFPDTL